MNGYEWLRITFHREVFLKAVKLIPYSYGSTFYSDSICVYAGQTATDPIGCINDGDEFERFELLSMKAQMIPTQQILIEFNESRRALLHELEIDYYNEGQLII